MKHFQIFCFSALTSFLGISFAHAATDHCRVLHPEWGVVYDSQRDTIWMNPDLIKNKKYTQSSFWKFEATAPLIENGTLSIAGNDSDAYGYFSTRRPVGEIFASDGYCYGINLDPNVTVSEKSKWVKERCYSTTCSEDKQIYFLEFTTKSEKDWWAQTQKVYVSNY
ncbi:hypothetical protein K2X30_02510 [bacterium]|jgi:hypothetical protein|nr:hypothetical protein [bacterium]